MKIVVRVFISTNRKQKETQTLRLLLLHFNTVFTTLSNSEASTSKN